MVKVFVDTCMFKALIDRKDEFHEKAVRIWEKIEKGKDELMTSNYVLDESFTLIRLRCGLEKANDLRKMVSSSGDRLKVVRVTMADEAGAWKWFVKNWSKLSFTDCVSFSMMKGLEVKRVAGFDGHFKRAGFKIEK